MNQLTPNQRSTLQVLLKFRDDPPTTTSMVVANWKRYLFLMVIFTFAGTCAGAGALLGLSYAIPAGCVFGGILFGLLLSDYRAMANAERMWSVTREVIDWRKVQQLLDEDDCERGKLPDEDATENDKPGR